MPTVSSLRPPLLLVTALLAATACAQDEEPTNTPQPDWHQNAAVLCQQQYSAEECENEQFLEDHFHTGTQSASHRAATRRKQAEQAALRELTLQRACHQSASKSCANASDPDQCAAELAQACSTLATQAALCQQNVLALCATDAAGSACVAQHSAYCPSLAKQPIADLLLKYPKLTLDQQARVANFAQQLDSQSSWFGDLFSWIGL